MKKGSPHVSQTINRYIELDHDHWGILFIVEIAFFHGGMIVSALFCGFLIYIGWRKFHRLWGKFFFWIGVIGLAFSVFNTLAVRFLLIASIILFIIDYSKSKKKQKESSLPLHWKKSRKQNRSSK